MYSPFMHSFGPMFGAFAGLTFIFLLWSLVWKGLALWHAARNKQPFWFVALLILNTGGILEIVYLVLYRADRATRSFSSLFSMGGVKSMMTSSHSSPQKKEDATLPVAESSPE